MSALQDLRVLVTRPRGQSSALADLLRQHGADPILIPTIELAPPASWCALDAALTTLRAFDWLVFTSANAVAAFATRARTLKLPTNAKRVAAIGPATARAVTEALGRIPELVPPQAVAESFAEALTPHAPGASMLLVRAAVARDALPAALIASGAAVTIAEAYRNVIPAHSVEELGRLFADSPPHAITFTSASTATNLAALLDHVGPTLPPGTILASIGPITSAAMRELGWNPTIEALEANIPSLVAALASYISSQHS